jgi:hypothetical protein
MAFPWREHVRLRGHFHPEHPDDLQILLHDGGPQFTDVRPELLWVRVGDAELPVFVSTLLNDPARLVTVRRGQTVRFIVPERGPHPLMVTREYLADRPFWRIHACDKCQLTELFDPPSLLARKSVPHLPEGAQTVNFTTACGFCGGVQVVERRVSISGDMGSQVKVETRSWWQFWR